MKAQLNPIDSISYTLAFAPKDWSIDKNDAWIYGIVAGWNDESLSELRELHGWTHSETDRLKKLHFECQKINRKYNENL